MISRIIRPFSYTPASPLIFKDGKCELFREQKLNSIFNFLKINFIAIPTAVVLAVGTNSGSLFSGLINVLAPFSIYGLIFLPIMTRSVEKMFLHEDGKTISFCPSLPKNSYKTIKISEMKPIDERIGFFDELFYKPFIYEGKGIFLISKAAEFLHQDVVEKILEGEEIEVNSVGNNNT